MLCALMAHVWLKPRATATAANVAGNVTVGPSGPRRRSDVSRDVRPPADGPAVRDDRARVIGTNGQLARPLDAGDLLRRAGRTGAARAELAVCVASPARDAAILVQRTRMVTPGSDRHDVGIEALDRRGQCVLRRLGAELSLTVVSPAANLAAHGDHARRQSAHRCRDMDDRFVQTGHVARGELVVGRAGAELAGAADPPALGAALRRQRAAERAAERDLRDVVRESGLVMRRGDVDGSRRCRCLRSLQTAIGPSSARYRRRAARTARTPRRRWRGRPTRGRRPPPRPRSRAGVKLPVPSEP